METKVIKTDVIALQKLMIEKGYRTITSLAAASGVNRTTLGDILNEKAQPTYKAMMKLVMALDMSESQAGCIFFATTLRNP